MKIRVRKIEGIKATNPKFFIWKFSEVVGHYDIILANYTGYYAVKIIKSNTL